MALRGEAQYYDPSVFGAPFAFNPIPPHQGIHQSGDSWWGDQHPFTDLTAGCACVARASQDSENAVPVVRQAELTKNLIGKVAELAGRDRQSEKDLLSLMQRALGAKSLMENTHFSIVIFA
jgi:hypothetical protein